MLIKNAGGFTGLLTDLQIGVPTNSPLDSSSCPSGPQISGKHSACRLIAKDAMGRGTGRGLLEGLAASTPSLGIPSRSGHPLSYPEVLQTRSFQLFAESFLHMRARFNLRLLVTNSILVLLPLLQDSSL